MKVYFSVDMEGLTGVTHWDEVCEGKLGYEGFQKEMTAEVKAACNGALAAGAETIWIKDAHNTARNILVEDLPECVHMIRGWSLHPFGMVQELDESFSAVVMIGYHSPAGKADNPLGHTFTSSVNHIKINDQIASEFLIYTYAAALVKVPVVFVAGDEGLCTSVKELNPHITTVAVHKGVGNSTISIHPAVARRQIREGVQQALQGDLQACKVTLPDHFRLELSYKDTAKAYKNSHYPGARLIDPRSIVFETDQYMEVMRMLMFVTW